MRVEARSGVDTLARYEQAKAVLQALAEKGRQAAIKARGVAPGQGAASWAPSPESRVNVARVGGLADGSGNEGSIVEQQQQMATHGGRSGAAEGPMGRELAEKLHYVARAPGWVSGGCCWAATEVIQWITTVSARS